MRILEIGAGREWIKWIDYIDHEIICVDQLYVYDKNPYPNIRLEANNIIKFLETYTGEPFDKVVATRVFEHFDTQTVSYVLYLLRQICVPDAQIEIIVPDFIKVSEVFRLLDPDDDPVKRFNKSMIDTHSEIFNEPSDPHQSLWSPTMAKYYLTLENYWSEPVLSHVELDGRTWYLKIVAYRV